MRSTLLFAATPSATLFEHGWLAHPEFLDLLRAMDVCLQCSFSETFNIVIADAVRSSVPVVTSREVAWLKEYAIADPASVPSMVQRLMDIQRQPRADRLAWQWRDLKANGAAARQVWWERFGCGGNVPIP